MIEQNRTDCKYGNCWLEKLENEFNELKEIWDKLKSNWAYPLDYEDIYRMYPLLDTTAVLVRKMLNYRKKYWSKYKIEIVIPATYEDYEKKDNFDTSIYYYSDDKDLYYGSKSKKQLNDIVSTFIHADGYVYKDTRTDEMGVNEFEIYLKSQTDKRTEFIKIDDYVKALGNFINDEINLIMKK